MGSVLKEFFCIRTHWDWGISKEKINGEESTWSKVTEVYIGLSTNVPAHRAKHLGVREFKL
jgi:hypothetical protein